MTPLYSLLCRFTRLSLPRRFFLLAFFRALLSFSGRATLRNLSRYGAGSERNIARHIRKPFDFPSFNLFALQEAGITSHPLLAVLDPTFLPKSGKHTFGLASFYNSCSSRPERGLEACVLGLVDLTEHTAYTLSASQTPPSLPEGESRLDFYLSLVKAQAHTLRRFTEHLAADGFFAKSKFLDGLREMDLHLVSKLRHDAQLRYLYEGPKRKGPGRPRLYDGPVDFSDLSRFRALESPKRGVELFEAILNHPHFGRNLKVVVVRKKEGKKEGRQLLFSTDLSLPGEVVYQYYHARFQQEFVFRDAKQYTGLGHAQVRDEGGLHFCMNASLSALNLLRLEDRAEQAVEGRRVISIASWKRRNYNKLLLSRFLAMSGIDSNDPKIQPHFHALLNYGAVSP